MHTLRYRTALSFCKSNSSCRNKKDRNFFRNGRSAIYYVTKAISPRKLKESEYEELIRLRTEIAYIKAENEVIKKEIALREEKEAVRLKAKKQRLLKRSESKDIN